MKRVLVAPLDWGLGHATRCIPIIEELLGQSCEVIIGGSGDSLKLLTLEFPLLETITLPEYSPTYPSTGSGMSWYMLKQLPKFASAIFNEHQQLDAIIRARGIDLVISDNRYGLWSQKVKSIFVTHQLNIQAPQPFKSLINAINRFFIRKFDECWIPDSVDENNSLAGKLAIDSRIRSKRIGILSRFKEKDRQTTVHSIDLLVVLSGPEPQRTMLERLMLKKLTASSLKWILVRGVVATGDQSGSDHIVDYATARMLHKLLESAEIVICRSGYSTLMDLCVLSKKAILIPTPGQPEQEYLGQRMQQLGVACAVRQEEQFNLEDAIECARSRSGKVVRREDSRVLREAIEEVVK